MLHCFFDRHSGGILSYHSAVFLPLIGFVFCLPCGGSRKGAFKLLTAQYNGGLYPPVTAGELLCFCHIKNTVLSLIKKFACQNRTVVIQYLCSLLGYDIASAPSDILRLGVPAPGRSFFICFCKVYLAYQLRVLMLVYECHQYVLVSWV